MAPMLEIGAYIFTSSPPPPKIYPGSAGAEVYGIAASSKFIQEDLQTDINKECNIRLKYFS